MVEPSGPPRHRSFVGPVVLILLGTFFLLIELYPEFDPWPWLLRYWPLILIAIGLGKIWDSYYAHGHPERATGPWITGTGLAWLILILFFMLAFWRGPHWRNWGTRQPWNDLHDTQSVELEGAKSVSVDLQFSAGRLTLTGGSSRLLDADFRYDRSSERPRVDYSLSGNDGHLTVSSGEGGVHWGPRDNDWDLRLGTDAAINLDANIGAGESYLRLGGLNVQSLKINMGVGRLDLDLTGPRKANLDATVEGGVGSAMIRLPRDVGVRVNVSGGIGSVNPGALRREGDSYENDAYGKTPSTIDMTVHGGIGQIELIEQ
jgi:uncharacterized protein DUF2154/cell wall-active antibiotic response 4TMS protein YvqF